MFASGDKVRRKVTCREDWAYGDAVFTVKDDPVRCFCIDLVGLQGSWIIDKFELVEFPAEPKFVVGKKYIHNATSVHYKCVGFSPKGLPIFENSMGYEFIPIVEFLKNYKEAPPEKKKGTFWVNVYNKVHITHTSRELADLESSPNRLACIEVPWKEGQGL